MHYALDMAITDFKTFRLTRCWTRQRLADELGVNLSTISRWETGSAEPRPYAAQALEMLADKYPPVPATQQEGRGT